MNIKHDYLFHGLISTKKAFEKIMNLYYTDSTTYDLVSGFIKKIEECISDFSNSSHYEALVLIHSLNIIEEYLTDSVPKNYPTENKLLLKMLWENKVSNNKLNILVLQRPNISYHHLSVENVDSPFVFLCIPKHYQKEVLLNSILIHELGHYFDVAHNNGIHAVRSETIPYEITEKLRKKGIDSLSWTKEFFADSFFLKLAGLSCFFSMYELLFNIDFIENSVKKANSHPYRVFRFEQVKDNLKYFENTFFETSIYSQKVTNLINDCESSYNSILSKSEYNLENLPGYELLTNFNNKKETFLSEVKGINSSKHIDDYVKQITHLIPPKIKDNDDIINIVSAGWIAYYFEKKEIASRANINVEDIENIRLIVNNLVRKSISNTYITKVWKDNEIN